MVAKTKQIKKITTMKKIFIAALVLAAASCAKNEVVNLNQEAISFGDAFIENSTRAIYESANNLTGFTVFGKIGEVALYGNGATVTRDSKALGAAWNCSITRYWTPNATFNFAAIANGTAKTLVNGLPTVISYTVNNDPADLIYATASATTGADSVPVGDVTDGKVVKFNFQHLLSRIKVGFVNQIPETDYTYNIKNVKITTWKNGEYTIGETTPWAEVGNDTADLTYDGITALGNSATATAVGAQLVIPGSTVKLSFDYELCVNGTPIYTTSVSKDVNVVPVQNYSYYVTVQLKVDKKIEFTVDATNGLTDWGNDSPVTIQ